MYDLNDIKRLWIEFDPIGVYGPGSDWPDDEYNSYLGLTLELLEHNASFEQIKNEIHSIVHDHMMTSVSSSAIDEFVTKLLRL